MSITPSLVMIPSGYKAQKVYSAVPTNGDGDFDFARSTSATRVNKDGLIEEVAVNVPRLDYSDGGCPSLLLEPTRSNLVTYSEDFSNAAWSKFRTTITPNTIISPSGYLVADSFIEDSTNNSHVLRFNYTPNTSNYIFSVFAKSLSGNRRIILSSSFETSFAIFNIENGTVVSSTDIDSSKIEDYGNGWYKCTVEKANNSISGNFDFRLDNGTTETYQGDGTSGVYIYGASLEQGSYATSYIPTSGSVVTRVAETANGAGDASTFNDSEGVLMAEISALSDDGTFRVISINGTATNVNEDRIQIYFRDTANIINFGMESGNSSQFFAQFPLDVKLNNKLALKYSASSCSFWINGIKVGEQLNKVMPTGLSRLDFVRQDGNDEFFYGNTKQIQYFDSALTDSELQALTKI